MAIDRLTLFITPFIAAPDRCSYRSWRPRANFRRAPFGDSGDRVQYARRFGPK
jgi:hypothetical protein